MLRKKGWEVSIVLTAASSHMGEDGEQNEKKGMEDLIAVKLQLLHGVSYLILF